MEDWAAWDAVETADRIRRGEVSAEEVCDAAIARAEDAGDLGAIVAPMFDRARRSLATADASAPLHGVPSAIKDLFEVKGVATAWGSRAASPHVSTKNDPFVPLFEGTGLVPLAKSATPEFGLTATTEPLLGPICRNPWNREHSTGGSSGGAASLVSAGVVPIAHASDGGGSIRIPASCCGLVGLKPTRGRADMAGSKLLPINIAVHGCVSRSVRDTIAFWDALSPGALPRPRLQAGLRVGLYTRSGLSSLVHEDNQLAAREAARLCDDLGHHVEEIECPFSGSLNDDFFLYWSLIAWVQKTGGKLLVHKGFDASKLEPWSLDIARFGGDQKRAVAAATLRLWRLRRAYDHLMTQYDVLLSPTLASPPPPLGYLSPDQPFETKRRRLMEYSPFVFVQNVTGTPGISLPLGRSAKGLPIGVHLGGRFGEDAMLLSLAQSLEAAAPWPATPSS